MSDDLDLRGIDQRHEPDPHFRAALHTRLAAIGTSIDPGTVGDTPGLSLIDLEPATEESEPSRNGRRTAKVILAVAAVVAIIVVASSEAEVVMPADEPSPTTPAASTPQRLPLGGNQPEPLEPGTYFVDDVEETPTPRIMFTLGAGWSTGAQLEGAAIIRNDFSIAFSHPGVVFSDACHWSEGYYQGPVDTVDDLIAALTAQKGWAGMTTPSDISVDGYTGEAFQRTARADKEDCDREDGYRSLSGSNRMIRSWQRLPATDDLAQTWFGSGGGVAYEPGTVETLWVLDIDGVVVVINAKPIRKTLSAAESAVLAAVLDSIRIDPPESRSVVSPLIDIRPKLAGDGDVEMFTVDTDQPRYLALTALGQFDGTRWSSVPEDIRPATGTLGPAPSNAKLVTQRITIKGLEGLLVPAARTATSATSLGPTLSWADEGGALYADGGLEADYRYQVTSVDNFPTPEQLRTTTVGLAPDPIYYDLPDSVPDLVGTLANEVTASATTPYDKARALQDWFRTNFEHSLTVQSGHSNLAMLNFINAKKGYCEQFSSTFAAMARWIGLPTRVVVGFTPGILGADGLYHVAGRHAHSWDEVWFDGYGWVQFDPTPGRGAPGAETTTGVEAQQAAP